MTEKDSTSNVCTATRYSVLSENTHKTFCPSIKHKNLLGDRILGLTRNYFSLAFFAGVLCVCVCVCVCVLYSVTHLFRFWACAALLLLPRSFFVELFLQSKSNTIEHSGVSGWRIRMLVAFWSKVTFADSHLICRFLSLDLIVFFPLGCHGDYLFRLVLSWSLFQNCDYWLLNVCFLKKKKFHHSRCRELPTKSVWLDKKARSTSKHGSWFSAKLRGWVFAGITWCGVSPCTWWKSGCRRSGQISNAPFSCSAGSWRRTWNDCGLQRWQHFTNPSHTFVCFHTCKDRFLLKCEQTMQRNGWPFRMRQRRQARSHWANQMQHGAASTTSFRKLCGSISRLKRLSGNTNLLVDESLQNIHNIAQQIRVHSQGLYDGPHEKSWQRTLFNKSVHHSSKGLQCVDVLLTEAQVCGWKRKKQTMRDWEFSTTKGETQPQGKSK